MSVSERPTLRLILSLGRSRARQLSLGLLALVIVDIFQLYVPRVIKFGVDELTLGQATFASLFNMGLIIMGLALGMALLRLVWRPILFGFARQVEKDLRSALFERVQSLDLAYFQKNTAGELMARATNDLTALRLAVGLGMVAAMDSLVLGLATIGFMVYLNPTLTFWAFLPMPLMAVAGRLVSKRMHRQFVRGQEAFADLTELVRETLSGIMCVKTYGLSKRETSNLHASGRRLVEVNMSLARVMGFFFPLMTLYTNLSLALVLAVGGPLAILGDMTPGDFVAFAAYLNLLSWPMMALGWVVSMIQRALGAGRRIDEVLKARSTIKEPLEPQKTGPEPPGFSLSKVTFYYPEAGEPALKQVSLAIEPGKVTGLVGPVGCGKSTLLLLLARLYEPQEGEILVQGKRIDRLSLDSLRGIMAQSPQGAFLFTDTVRANLSLGKPDATDDELWSALENAELASEVEELPQGLDTRLGERAQTLSGGQRQRLSLARALLTDAPFLVLDDPLSAVDTDTERRILKNLSSFRKGRTTLVVSHRLASVAFADQIVVLEKGAVVEKGDHNRLMAKKGLYHKLFAEQAELAGLES
ncbi:ABC transporter ATP-binding protein [Dethiosulfatarculus sandiegensis]|uniref:ABC transporter ATP-binding protein n=1 Tax=Dethiosulfatarculus sandiegensis TaxID=1429043 RepID=A0A0D2GJ31_9BACT|nr:ABC transporter ATP-binding protein [Dethiosulfatarculus sandiegensis]KIX14817.1 hypothetical protein X474_06640 [Dethiosulfatarculus sandiegensis]